MTCPDFNDCPIQLQWKILGNFTLIASVCYQSLYYSWKLTTTMLCYLFHNTCFVFALARLSILLSCKWHCLLYIPNPLANMVNLSFEQGVFPTELKIAVITPLHKAKDPMFFNNYRPISLLSVFSKIFERLMYNRILYFINRHKLFNKFQFGFRNNHSTFMALIILIENLVNALDNGKCAVGIFLDFQKAFDTVNHSIWLDKLQCYGIRGIANQWLFSYLSNRQQSVVYNGYESELKVINNGVPQGSILGPLLFLLYINDLTNVSSFFMPILFAEDTNLFYTGTDLKYIIRLVNEEISKIYGWVNANNISLNIDKTNFMLFTP